MRELNTKRITIAIILIIVVIIEIIAFGISRAQNVKEITLYATDKDGLLEIEETILNALDDEESGYFISLPNIINEKKIICYEVTEKQIQENEEETESTVEKYAGETIYLTEDELTNAQINIGVWYDKIELENADVLYNKTIEKDEIIVSGYMPINATLEVQYENLEEYETILDGQIGENESANIYTIQIIDNEEIYLANEVEQTLEIKVTNIDSNSTYRILKLVENQEETTEEELQTTLEEISDFEIENESIVFTDQELGTYVLVMKESETISEISLLSEATLSEETEVAEVASTDEDIVTIIPVTVTGGEIWEGNIATGFALGEGTLEFPYLITNGDELAYLAEQVNSGTTYEGIYFQVTNDINLNSLEWTPIGDIENSFRGIFDGAGHTISNASIDISSSTNDVVAYGIFGSIGGGSSYATIKNVEFDAVNITMSVTRTIQSDDYGYKIGTIAGVMYNHSQITNVIVKNSSIIHSGTITARYNNRNYYAPIVFVGGLVGDAVNSNDSTTDPGDGSRALIKNCYSNVDISLNVTATRTGGGGGQNNNAMRCYAQTNIGGIIGRIKTQNIWPSNCLYEGTITTSNNDYRNGMVGPIFGAEINNTTYTSTDNMNTIWNGDNSNSLSIDSYYTNYNVYGTEFTTSVTSGTAGTTTDYRRNTTATNIGYVQGVNKGIYLADRATMVTNFNNNLEDSYVSWQYSNGEIELVSRLTAEAIETANYSYEIQVTDNYNVGTYTYEWYVNGELDEANTGTTFSILASYEQDNNILVLIDDGTYYTVTKFIVPKLSIEIEFDIDESNNIVEAVLTGTALPYVDIEDYTFQWYTINPFTYETEIIEGETTTILENLQNGTDYKLVATNNEISVLSAENSFAYGERIVVFVDYTDGNNNNDGFTPETAVKNMATAYSKLSETGERNENIIVMIGNYTDNQLSFYNSETATTYAKKATITGVYAGIDYEANWRFGSYYSYFRYLTADTTFQYLIFNGNGGSMYLICQGHSVTFGEDVTMTNYATANTNQGLLGSNAPAFHLFGGWYQYNYSTLPNNNSEIVIKSGTYGRIILGGTPGTAAGMGQTTSHDFTGSSMDDAFNVSILVNIENSTTESDYDYDINLLVGGSACGNTYSRVTENIQAGTIGRVLGASIGDSSELPNWNYPENTFLGETTINITGGTIQELYGGCLGRNMDVVGNANATGNTCESYFYGNININMTGGTIANNIYGAGAGGVTGYSENSSDPYKSYGEDFETSVNINISGGSIEGNVYGGGYGYTEYLNANVTAEDGGALYGISNIIITNSPTISGNIYGAGCGYNLTSKPEIAQMYGNTYIEIGGLPFITGEIYGAGAGVSGYEEMAKLVGTSNIKINTNLDVEVYGGGNIAKVEGTTEVSIESGTHTATIYGGGNLGIIDGNANVYINGGISADVYGGGNQAEVTETNVYINDGTTTNVFGGGNEGTVEITNVLQTNGRTSNVYGGGNKATVETTNVEINGGISTNIFGGGNEGEVTETIVKVAGGELENVYGGGNKAAVETTNVEINGGISTNIFGGGNEGNATTTNIDFLEGETTNVFGGGNSADAQTTNINLVGGSIENVFGGSNQVGDVTTSNILTSASDEISLIVVNIYGGNNEGGSTTTANITTNGGEIDNVYGGGNRAVATNTFVTINGGNINSVYGGGNQAIVTAPYVEINSDVNKNVYGGGNAAGIEGNTILNITAGTIGENIYGGGNEGTVTGNTNVNISSATILGSAYAGGNGVTAIVYGNTNINVENEAIIGTEDSVAPAKGSLFGGGNAAATGSLETNNSTSTVNIVGGTIYGNVYGGANTSVVYGIVNVNIGKETVNNEDLQISDIYIRGTIFGGGEANASGSENYDYSFISVTTGITINIDGNGYTKFGTNGSIFGSGNASSTSGESYINIKNYGTIDNPQSNISIQRANLVTIDNSSISLSGTTDRTNEYSNTFFTFSRIDELKLKNSSSLYLNYGANLLKKFSSLVDIDGVETVATVIIDEETGETTKNVDNRMYLLEGRNLNIATNEQATAHGEVVGMTFLGLFSSATSPSTSTGLYNQNFENEDEITNAGTFLSNSYVKGAHKENHDITIDGFYTNINNEGYIKTQYVEVTPEDDTYYIWLVGEQLDITVFEVEMIASKYATLGTYELALTGFSTPNIKFILSGFSSGLNNGISLVDELEIEPIEEDEDRANNTFGLTIESGKSGWKTNNETKFFTENGGYYLGNNIYDCDNSTFTPSLLISFFHSQNLTEEKDLGTVTIRYQVITPIDDLTVEIAYVDIIITLSTALYQDDFYEAAISPGEEFSLFTTTETNITETSMFSVYYSLLIDNFTESDYYDEYTNYKRVLVSRNENDESYVLPQNTTITMLDLANNKYYYYVVTETDETNNKYIYYLDDFIHMGSTDSLYDETSASSLYYNETQDLIYENFIFHVDFSQSTINEDTINNTLLIELQDDNNETLIGVLGIERDTTKYSIYKDKEAVINIEAAINPETIYLGNQANLSITTDFSQSIISSKTIYDTKYFNQKMGIKITIHDSNGNQLNSDSLLGIIFKLDDVNYYPRIDGSIRIKISDRVTNVLSKIIIDTSNNTTLATGTYSVKIETFGSSDGIYYGLESSASQTVDFIIINGAYGLKATTTDESKIIDKETGNTLEGSNSLVTFLDYSSMLENPKITVTLLRRKYDTIYSMEYEIVDLDDYVSTTLTTTSIEDEYLVAKDPGATTMFFLSMNDNILSGTYKLVFKLYDGTTYIGETFEYFIIK